MNRAVILPPAASIPPPSSLSPARRALPATRCPSTTAKAPLGTGSRPTRGESRRRRRASHRQIGPHRLGRLCTHGQRHRSPYSAHGRYSRHPMFLRATRSSCRWRSRGGNACSNDIFAGMNAVDYSGYPDCRPSTWTRIKRWRGLPPKRASRARGITIHTPIIHDQGRHRARRHAAGVDYAMTVSCYRADDTGRACGACDSCRLRRGIRRGTADHALLSLKLQHWRGFGHVRP